jgi:3-hydroxyisobutyrate dehydrogenase
MKVGFVGLGRMGWPMASNLIKAGLDVTVWNRSHEKSVMFVDSFGGKFVEKPAQIASECDVIVSMLADDEASGLVHFGNDGLFSLLQNSQNTNSKVFIEMGTISPEHLNKLVVAAATHKVIDAPVSGSTKAAAEGDLLIMAGCKQEDCDALASVFSPMSREVIALQNSGAGCVMKLSVNMLIHGINQCLAESMVLAESTGISSKDAFKVIEKSAAASPSIRYRKELYMDDLSHPVSFTVALAKKDIGLALAIAKNNNVDLAQTEITYTKLVKAIDSGYGERDMAAMVKFIRQENVK